MKRYILPCLAMAVIGVVAGLAHSQDEPLKVFMRSKLEHSQKLLENLALEDFQAMSTNSQALSLLSLAASWQVMQTPEYAHQSLEFRRAADAMTEAARKKNLDGAALAYVEMTMKCVNCHKYVRGVRLAAEDRPAVRLAVKSAQ